MAVDIEARVKLVDDHVQAEVDTTGPDHGAVGQSPWFDDVALGRAVVRAGRDPGPLRGAPGAFPDLAIELKARHVTDEAVILEVVVSGTR